MKIIFTWIAGMLIPSLLQAQELSGRWQEVQRWTEQNSPAPFSDTLRIHFMTPDSIKYQQKGVLAFVGRYQILGNSIAVEDAVHFFITSKKKDELQLLYDHYKRKLIPVEHFSDERSFYDSAYIHYGRNIDLSVFEGKWLVYKREGILPSRSFWMMSDITFQQGKGILFRYNWSEGKTDSITYSLKSRMLELESASFKYAFSILKADKDEIILKDLNLVYYLKPAR